MERDQLLKDLQKACMQSPPDIAAILLAMENLLVWLNEPANNTHENCVTVDLFVTLQVHRTDEIPKDIIEVLDDIGGPGALHDTHSAPEIAENFESTPPQLLARIQHLRKIYG